MNAAGWVCDGGVYVRAHAAGGCWVEHGACAVSEVFQDLIVGQCGDVGVEARFGDRLDRWGLCEFGEEFA